MHYHPLDHKVILRGIRLYCNSCKAIYFQIIAGNLVRIDGFLYVKKADGSEIPYQKQPCPCCGYDDIWLWEII